MDRFQNGAILEPMPVSLSIKRVPDDVLKRLRERAVRNKRSLQGELLDVIERAAGEEPAPPVTHASRVLDKGRGRR